MMLATPVRSSAWSSTTSTRAALGATSAAAARDSDIAICRSLRPWYSKRRRLPGENDLGTGPRRGHERQRGPDALGALAHAGHAEAAVDAVAGDPAAIVGHRQAESDAAYGSRAHHDAAGVGMTDGVGQRLLRDADNLALHPRVQHPPGVDGPIDRERGPSPSPGDHS